MTQIPLKQAIELAIEHQRSGRLQQAEQIYRQILASDPNQPDALHLLGLIAYQCNRLDVAMELVQRAILIQPSIDSYHANFGKILADAGQIDAAIVACRRALQINPNSGSGWYNLGHALREQGEVEQGIEAFRTAVKLDSSLKEIHSIILQSLHLLPGMDVKTLLQAHEDWNRQFAAPLRGEIRPHDNNREANRRVRIGLVSPDFWDHALGRGLMPYFKHRDRNQVELVCYADMMRLDDFTRQFRESADVWRDITGQSDEQVTQLVRQDRVDILVDLALHAQQNRLLVFARKPAPVQVTFAGYPSTTGLETIDYRITDSYFDPPGCEDFPTTEKPYRLPRCYLAYAPLSGEGAVNSLPAAGNGYITFGCMAKFCKINEPLMKLWGEILNQVPGSRMQIVADVGGPQQRILNAMSEYGIAPERFIFESRRTPRDYLMLYQKVDVTLDVFPYNGLITTLDSLWMGVPVVSMAGQLRVSRSGLSAMSSAGLGELVAKTPEEYVRIAVELAGDLTRLKELRATLRQRLLDSPLMDEAGFARDLDGAFREMWKTWCSKK